MFSKGKKVSQNLPQRRILNTQHVLTYATPRHYVVTFQLSQVHFVS